MFVFVVVINVYVRVNITKLYHLHIYIWFLMPILKKLTKVLDIVEEFDLFAPHTPIRYKS
jgi:hypothetical protein